VTTHDGTVASGQTLTVNGSTNTSAINWDGSAETDGTFSMTGGSANDTLKGGGGADTISGAAGNDFLYGTSGNDLLLGGAGNDELSGGDGADTVSGGAGNDLLRAGANDDFLYGGDGSDTLSGGAGSDSLSGGAGNDVLSGGSGFDTLAGGAGNDTFTGSASDFNGDTISDFAVGDSIVVTGKDLSALNGTTASGTIDISGSVATTLTGITSGSGTFNAAFAGGNTTITLVAPPTGGGGGAPSGGGTVVVTDSTPTESTGGGRTITNNGPTAGTAAIVENTGNNSNVVTATLPSGMSITSQGPATAQTPMDAAASLLQAVEGRASLSQDLLISGARTFLNKLASTTLLDVRTIVPTTTSSTVSDPIVITGTSAADGSTQSEAFVIDLRSLPSGRTLQLDNIEFASVMGSATVTGGSGDNFVEGDDDSQFISLGVGDDTLFGGDGDDTVGSGDGNDELNGDGGNDRVFGGIGNDTVNGGSGNDVLLGNEGDDVLVGGLGRDVGAFSVKYQASFGWVQRYDGAISAEGDDRLESGVEILTFSDNRVMLTVDKMSGAASFNEAEYLAQNTDVADAVSAGLFSSGREHYEQHGQAEGRFSSADMTFDESYYLEMNSDVAEAVAFGEIASGRVHFEQHGQAEGRDPTPLFDSAFYLAENIDVAEAVSASVFDSAYEHYQLRGAQEGRAASQYFDTAKYLSEYTDVAESGMNALDHYLKYGIYEGRAGFVSDDPLV
ncbi:calcium-binding protein, partial [Thalassobaculum litoreum]